MHPTQSLFDCLSINSIAQTPIIMVTDDFKERAKLKVEAASDGKFFSLNSARLVPSFDRRAAAAAATADGDEGNNDDGEKIYINNCHALCISILDVKLLSSSIVHFLQ